MPIEPESAISSSFDYCSYEGAVFPGQCRTGTVLKSQTLCPLSRLDSHRCVALCMLLGILFPEELAVVSRDFHFYQEALFLIRLHIV